MNRQERGWGPRTVDPNFAFAEPLTRTAPIIRGVPILRQTDLAHHLGGQPPRIEESHSALTRREPGEKPHLSRKGRTSDRERVTDLVDSEPGPIWQIPGLSTTGKWDVVEERMRAIDKDRSETHTLMQPGL